MKMTFLLALAASTLLAQPRWVATWSTSPAPQLAASADMQAAKMLFQNQTFRQIVHTSIGGDTTRVRISNIFGVAALQIDGVHMALQATGSTIVADSDRGLTFSGRSSVSVPPNAVMISDPVPFTVPAEGNLVISVYLATAVSGAGIHYSAIQTNYIGTGDQTGSTTFTQTTTVGSWAFLAGVDVLAEGGGTIVGFGDSITDGANSTTSANHRWPNFLARRLLSAGINNLGVADSGIGGNRMLHDAAVPLNVKYGVNGLARFERDVIAVPGVRYVIILLGINDLGHPGTSSAPLSETVTAEDLIAGLTQMANRAHEMGIKVIGSTMTPFAGFTSAGWYTPDKDWQRNLVNDWIRSSDVFDAFCDFDIVLRDPNQPDRLQAIYDSGDHLHPGDAGYQEIATLVDLALFQ